MTSTQSRMHEQAPRNDDTILDIQDLQVHYATKLGPVRAVNGVSIQLKAGEKLGLVGESGSGKSTLASAVMRLIKPPGEIVGGRVLLDGRDILAMNNEELRQIRFAEIGLVPQGAMNSLNPVMKVWDQIADTIRAHSSAHRTEDIEDRIMGLLNSVDLDPNVANLYPHELSGGMRQRVCLAMAISLRPRVIIADEPTSALDVVVQRQVFDTLDRLQAELGIAVILVGHDMGLMAQFVDRVGVLYAGKLIELSPTMELFKNPLHPYTQRLIDSLPSLEERAVFRGIGGGPPSLRSLPSGCIFHPRCEQAMPHCSEIIPLLQDQTGGGAVACHLYTEDGK